MNYSYLQKIREYELGLAQKEMPAGSKVLEIGAGPGWQARWLTQKGYQVEAIDIAGSIYEKNRDWPVTEYDGRNIPFQDGSFDIVFSSNVLEHISHIEDFQAEIKRVLKPDGLVIHVLPTSWWRFWTLITHYPYLIKEVIRLVSN